MNILAAKILGGVIIALGLLLTGHHFGAQGVQAEWDKDTAVRKTAENNAIFQRIKENERKAEQHEIDNKRITKEKNDAMDKVRADIARAPGLRVGPELCRGFASGAETKGTGSSDGADTGGGMVSPETRRTIDALKIEVEEALAAGRACQEFVRSKGMAP